ncbi:MOS1T transposase, partial [Pseudoatta argentina]
MLCRIRQDKELEQLLDEDPSQTLSELGKILQVDESTISKRLKGLGMIQKQGHWVPYELKPRTTASTAEKKRFSFLHRIVTGDEKWIHYDNPKRRKSSILKTKRIDFRTKRAFDALDFATRGSPSSEDFIEETIVETDRANSPSARLKVTIAKREREREREGERERRGKKGFSCLLYFLAGHPYSGEWLFYREEKEERKCLENRGVSPAMHPEKRPLYAQRHDKVILSHDNARPHVAKPVKTYLETLKWKVVPHPLYSPDIAPSDFHLFRSMAHGLADRRLHSYEEAKKWIDSWKASKDMSLFRRGIHVLPERWEKVVSSDGQYFK